jgi:hypothetical protein
MSLQMKMIYFISCAAIGIAVLVPFWLMPSCEKASASEVAPAPPTNMVLRDHVDSDSETRILVWEDKANGNVCYQSIPVRFPSNGSAISCVRKAQ